MQQKIVYPMRETENFVGYNNSSPRVRVWQEGLVPPSNFLGQSVQTIFPITNYKTSTICLYSLFPIQYKCYNHDKDDEW